MSITVNLYYTGKDGSARRFAEEMVASGVVDAVRAEEGNERYEYFFSMEDPETVLLIDRWRDQAALDFHHKSPMMAQIAGLRDQYHLRLRWKSMWMTSRNKEGAIRLLQTCRDGGCTEKGFAFHALYCIMGTPTTKGVNTVLYKMTKAIYEELSKQKGLKVFTEEHEGSSCVWLRFGIDGGGDYRINFISHDNDKDVGVRVYALITIKENQREKMLAALNILNKKYRYLKFVLDDDGDVSIHYDYLMTDADPAESVTELTSRITQIVDDAYPILMRTMWAE